MPAGASAEELDDVSLTAGLGALGLGNRIRLQHHLQVYMALLTKWNQTYNLVSGSSRSAMISKHILDCLAVTPHLHGEQVLDVGTGAGLPGLVLAMAAERCHFTLLDANAKKTRFCRQVCAELGLANVDIVQTRVEDHHPALAYSSVVARAFGSVQRLFDQAAHWCEAGGRLLLLKGANVMREVDALGPIRENTTVVELRVPGLETQRQLVIVDVPAAIKRPRCRK